MLGVTEAKKAGIKSLDDALLCIAKTAHLGWTRQQFEQLCKNKGVTSSRTLQRLLDAWQLGAQAPVAPAAIAVVGQGID